MELRIEKMNRDQNGTVQQLGDKDAIGLITTMFTEIGTLRKQLDAVQTDVSKIHQLLSDNNSAANSRTEQTDGNSTQSGKLNYMTLVKIDPPNVKFDS